jgi:phosphatidylglycerophosphatase A
LTISPDTVAWLRWLASGLGSGWLPGAPGTWGSLICLLPAWLLLDAFGAAGLLIGSGLALVVGCVVCFLLLAGMQDKDPGWIVIDEWAGQWLCLALAADAFGDSLLAFALAFAIFRLLDIFKPWPICLFERLGPPWWSIMADDAAAGALGGLIVKIMAAASGVVS